MIMSKILLLGPRFNKRNPHIVGGIVMLFEDLLIQLEKKSIEVKVIDTNKNNYSNKLTAFISIYFQFFISFSNIKHISIHGTANDYLFIAPIIVIFSKLFNKKISLRKFAGNFDDIHKNSNILRKVIINYILRNSNLNFFETKYLVHYFKEFNKNTYWFPNVRNDTNYKTTASFNKNFIFVGQISNEKGINTILEASRFLDESYKIHLYGNLIDYKIEDFSNLKNVSYKGPLDSSNILKKMSEYDLLILPSLREGYPGVIIEALSVGLPIISTNLEGIKEMINPSCSILINTNSYTELISAIKYFSNENYNSFRKKSIENFVHFDSEYQTSLFIDRISNL